MQAIILAAGRGTRMGKLAEGVPKPLVKIAGKPVMEYVVELLVAHGVKEIGVNLFYLGDRIKNYFGNGSKWGIKIIYAEEKQLTGTAGGVKAVAKVLNPRGPFLVIPGDWIGNFDLASIYKFHLKRDGIVTLCGFYRPKDPIKDCGVILFDKKTKELKQYIEKPQTKEETISYWTSCGIYVFDQKFINFIPDEIDGSPIVDIPKNIFPKIFSSKEKMYIYPVNRNRFYQLGINRQEQIKQVEEDLVSRNFRPVL